VAENRVENIVDRQNADRFAELVDHRRHPAVLAAERLQRTSHGGAPGHVDHRFGKALQVLLGHRRERPQRDRPDHFFALGFDDQQVTAVRPLSAQVSQRHGRPKSAELQSWPHQLVGANFRKRDDALQHPLFLLQE
jgi:hypothetical protein